MMKKVCVYGFLGLSLFFSCVQNPKPAPVEKKATTAKVDSVPQIDPKLGQPIIPVASIMPDFKTFWPYYTQNIGLYEDFVPLNTKGKVISKKSFLKQMGTGQYFPLALHAATGKIVYRLEKIVTKTDNNIGAYMKMFSQHELKYLELKGKPVPTFHFTDIDGKVYTPENTKGKILLFKCWFIGCTACVAEMPDLNRLVEKYQDRKDILFISLAIDSKTELQQFLTKVKFDYATVPKQEKYMAEKLNVVAYPTHFIIDKQGILQNVLPDHIQVERELKKLLDTTN